MRPTSQALVPQHRRCLSRAWGAEPLQPALPEAGHGGAAGVNPGAGATDALIQMSRANHPAVGHGQ